MSHHRPAERAARHRGRAALACLAMLPLALATACGAASGAHQETGASRAGQVAPPLASVEPAADPRGWDGPVTAGVALSGTDPVQGPAPRLPAEVRDAQGTDVVVRDVSRVLALDLNGTLARTVAELGLVGSLVGRDLSTQFPEAADLPLVTGNAHDLSAEAILALDPTLIITDTTLGPWDVVLQMRDAGIPVVVAEATRTLGNLDEITRLVAGASASRRRGSCSWSGSTPRSSRCSPRSTRSRRRRTSGCARSSSTSAATLASTTCSAGDRAPTI